MAESSGWGTRTETPRRAGKVMSGLALASTWGGPAAAAAHPAPRAHDREGDALSRVDAHGFGCRRADWPSHEGAPPGTFIRGPASRLHDVNASRSKHHATTRWAREFAPHYSPPDCDVSTMSRAERIQLLEGLECEKAAYADVVSRKGRRMTAARAHCERSLRRPQLSEPEGQRALVAAPAPHRPFLGAVGGRDADDAAGAAAGLRQPGDGSPPAMQASALLPQGSQRAGGAALRPGDGDPDAVAAAAAAAAPADGDATFWPGDTAGGGLRGEDRCGGAESSRAKPAARRRDARARVRNATLSPQSRTARFRDESRGGAAQIKDSANEVARGLSDLRQLVGAGCLDSAEISSLSGALEAHAYKMGGDNALQAMALIAEAVSKLDVAGRALDPEQPVQSHRDSLADEGATLAMRRSLDRILGSVCARITEHKAGFVADALMTMATTRTGRQEYLDAMLAHSLLLLCHEPHSFTPSVLARIMGALGIMRAAGGVDGDGELCARAGANAECCSANQKFIQLLNTRCIEAIPAFLEDDVGAVHEGFLALYMEEDALKRFFYRAAQLQVGLSPGTAQHLHMLRRALSGISADLPMFVASLPPFTRQYCDRLR